MNEKRTTLDTPIAAPYTTPAEHHRLQRELSYLQLEVSQKKHYIDRTRTKVCEGWMENLAAQEARMEELENQLQGAYAYDTKRDYRDISNIWN